MSEAYDLFIKGTELLESGDYFQAIVSLERARKFEPDKASVREALGRAYFRAGQFKQALAEFEVVVEISPDNDFALFCLGRSLQMLGRHAEACRPLALACCLRPERKDFRYYRDRARAARDRR